MPTAHSARALLRAARFASLGTIDREDGSPIASLCGVATLADGTPVLLQSDLAQHTRNLKADDRASLLVAAAEPKQDPMAEPRVTFVGRVEKLADPEAARARYLARHPAAALYADFGDFSFYRLAVDRAHMIAGFGRVRSFEGTALAVPAGDLPEKEQVLIGSLSRTYAADLDLIARAHGRRRGSGWQLAGVDTDGADLRRKDAYLRVPFTHPVQDAESARTAFATLVRTARGQAR